MKVILIFIMLSMATLGHAIDFNDVKVPFYAVVDVTDGITPRRFDIHYDGKSKTSLVGSPPNGAPGNMRMVGDTSSSAFFFVANDPKKVVMTMNQREFAKALGVDFSSIKENGHIVGKKRFIGEECTHWRNDVSLSINGKIEKSYIEACVTDDNIPLWGKDNGKLVSEIIKLKRGSQDSALFSIPSGFKIIDMNKMLKALEALQNK